jgi:hypothetical protein
VTVKFEQGVPDVIVGNEDIREMDDKQKHDIFKMRSPKGRAKIAAARKKLPPSPVPALYGAADRTPLNQKVPPDGPVQLDLSSKTR